MFKTRSRNDDQDQEQTHRTEYLAELARWLGRAMSVAVRPRAVYDRRCKH
jgi:hypothetical protein